MERLSRLEQTARGVKERANEMGQKVVKMELTERIDDSGGVFDFTLADGRKGTARAFSPNYISFGFNPNN